MEMENTYLMWVGSESYSTIEEWVEEAQKQGVSKRLPNANVGAALKRPGTVVFVAHDEGEWEDCSDCMGKIENPDWRKKREKLENFSEEIAKYKVEEESITAALATASGNPEEAEKRKELENVLRKIVRREEKMSAIQEEIDAMEERIDGGTGGTVVVKDLDTGKVEAIDYRKYNYWWHQPKKFAGKYRKIGEPNMCEGCGGKGQLPVTRIFGLFVPSVVEYILKSEDDETVKKAVEERGFRTVSQKKLRTELKRKCGKRKEGGYYVVADTESDERRTKEVVEKMVSIGAVKPDGVEVKGNFVRFLSPVSVEGVKRFRGIKRWQVEEGSYVEEEAEMIMDALE
jgi:hypothetical protein